MYLCYDWYIVARSPRTKGRAGFEMSLLELSCLCFAAYGLANIFAGPSARLREIEKRAAAAEQVRVALLTPQAKALEDAARAAIAQAESNAKLIEDHYKAVMRQCRRERRDALSNSLLWLLVIFCVALVVSGYLFFWTSSALGFDNHRDLPFWIAIALTFPADKLRRKYIP